MIILINGSINSGKTTVAKILVKKIPKTAHIEKLRQFIEWMPIEESIQYNIKNIISLTKNFIETGGLNVLISYPVSGDNFELISKELNEKIYAFTLNPDLEIVTSNRGNRELKDWEIPVIKKSYEDGLNNPNYGVIINNSSQTPDETATEIMSHLPLK